ncbi:DUF4230 domain-containing protein [Streptomyces sp. Je 1-79]|uniref:DUF4230 domain-containing protein n=1 Tax=Streptomyces sp. Je 1-79 TaxID=2943847 RepID=UPI0021A4075F|nr:DUF4230 domain-containing protein [Streptomyces sp. Je 1-79]MCT4351831.1 DUF4230 domain-containing protein [Streptomyces sp. Je 1-79]
MRDDTETRPSRETSPRGRERGARRWPAVAAVLLALALTVVLLGRFVQLPGLGDLFASETRDRSGPAVLKSIQDMNRHEGALGTYQVVVDLEKDARFLPDAIRGTRTLYVANGSVSSYVDLSRLGADAVTVDEERTTATLRLPHAQLGDPALDPERSYAVSKQRGLLDRLGDLFSDNPASESAVHRLAAQHIGEAARESDLTIRAERNTTAMLQGLLRALGFEQVTVTYA